MHRDWDFGHWRRSELSVLCRSGYEIPIFFQNIEVATKTLQPYGHGIALDILYEFTGYISDMLRSLRNDAAHVHGISLSLACIDVFIATAMDCFRKEYREKDAGQGKKLLYTLIRLV